MMVTGVGGEISTDNQRVIGPRLGVGDPSVSGEKG